MEYLVKGTIPERHRTMKMAQSFILDEERVLNFIKKNTRYEEDSMKLAVPKELKQEILEKCHDDTFAGHMGIKKTVARIRERFWWSEMRPDIKKYIGSCKTCATMSSAQARDAKQIYEETQTKLCKRS